jgi:hypothetical protein
MNIKIDGVTKIIVLLLAVSVIACGVVFYAASFYPTVNAAYQSPGNFTIVNVEVIGSDSIYTLLWNGNDASVRIDGVYSNRLTVSDNQEIAVLVNGESAIYVNEKLMLTLP